MVLGRRVEIKTIRPYSLFKLNEELLPFEAYVYNNIHVDVTFNVRNLYNAIRFNLL